MAIDFDALDLVRSQNKSEQYERQKIKFLEDRIATLEKSVGSLNKMIGELQQAEYERDINDR